MFDTAGSRLNFPVVAGVEETFRVSFWVGGSGMSVLGATFQAACYVAHGDERGELVAVLPVEHESAENKVRLTVPELEHGHYWWELRVTDAVGKECRLLYGTLAALTSAEVARLAAEAEESSLRELMVEIGGGYAAPLVLRWQACSVAASLAADAARAAERAEAAADRAEDAEENVLGKLGAAQAFMESFNKALFEAIRVVDNYLWVGGVNTGHYLKGNDGITPHIGTDGYWYVGNKRLGDRPAFGKDGIMPHITADGFWAFGDWKSSARAEGRDGLDGTAVRFIIVESVEDIPTEGETCNGGFRYCVPVSSERMHSRSSVLFGESLNQGNYAGNLVFAARRAWNRDVGRLYELSLMCAAESNGEPSEELLYAHIYFREAGDWLYAGCSTEAVAQVASQWSTWRFDGLCVPAGLDVRVLLSQQSEQVAAEGSVETVRVRVVSTADGSLCGGRQVAAQAQWRYLDESVGFYDVYAWMEDGEGNGVWHLMNRTYDFATAQVYGLMKYATDSVVAGGAPVGRNAEGQACVPIADPALPGSVMPASASGDAEGGQTFVRDGRMWVRMANLNLPGVGKTSYTRVVANTNSIGLTEDGKFAVPPAAAFQWGVNKVGTSVPQSMGMPWIIPVGAAAEGVQNEYGQDITGQLMNNVLVGGALRTALKSTWLSWGPNGINVNLLPDNSNAVGLMTSRSFRQSAEQGLELEQATNSLLGGVTVCSTIGSGSGLVPTVSAMVNYLRENYYTKSQVYSREETYSKAQVDAIDKKNRQDAAETYKTTAAAKTDHDALSGRIDGCVKKSESWNGEVYLTLSEYQALKVRDPKIAYNILEDVK